MKKLFFGNEERKSVIITRIAMMLALTIAMQYITALAKNQILTGSSVNLMLLVSTAFCGLAGGAIVGLFSPFIAFFIGMSSNIVLTPFIAISNAILVSAFALITHFSKSKVNENIAAIIAIICGAALKFLFLFFVALKLVLPLVMTKVPPQVEIMFGVTQLITALIGGVCALVVLKLTKKILIK